jgi:cation:H+ antiporter
MESEWPPRAAVTRRAKKARIMRLEEILWAVAGSAMLIAGAEFLVKAASRLARRAGISPLVAGLTVVAYGTSSPEMAVSIGSAFTGQGDIAVGNVIGSNIFNVLFIVGLSALIVPLKVSQQLLWLDVPLMIGASLLLLVLALDGSVSRTDGVVLLAGAVLYTVFIIREARKESALVQEEYSREFGGEADKKAWPLQLLSIFIGLGMLVYGARWLVDGAVAIARSLGVSELVIGLTLVAAGTSLPEVAASVVASIRGERDIAVGNVIGSNLFNILVVLGLGALVAPNGINVAPAALRFDIPVMIAVAIACSPIFFTGHSIARWEGAVFLLYYAAYTVYVILNARGHDLLPAFSAAMLEFVIPLTVITLAIGYVRHAAKARRSKSDISDA